MKVWVLIIGYDVNVIRVFTTAEACDKAADEYRPQPIAIETVELEEKKAQAQFIRSDDWTGR